MRPTLPDRKPVKLQLDEIVRTVDAVFEPDYDGPGWVFVWANARGRDLINGLFPRGKIAWDSLTSYIGSDSVISSYQFPADWMGSAIHVPEVHNDTGSQLPLDVVPAGMQISDASPDQLALLLAFGVERAGSCAARVEFNPQESDPLPYPGEPTFMLYGPDPTGFECPNQ